VLIQIDMNVDDEVLYINNEGTVSDEICILIEENNKYCRIKRPNGEIIRIFPDRVMPRNMQGDHHRNTDITNDKEHDNTNDSKKFDPFDSLSHGCEVWVKSNNFSDSVICLTYAIIDPNGNSYQSVNTYNGVAKKVMSYSMKNYQSLINKLKKRGYTQESQ